MRRWSVFAVLGCALLGGTLRLAAMERTFPVALVGDEYYYVIVASQIARGEGHQNALGQRAVRPPGHPFLLSRFISPGHATGELSVEQLARALDRRLREVPALREFLRPLVLLQVLLGGLLVGGTAWLALALFDLRAAVAAGGIAALYPNLIAQSHYVWSENLFALLVTLGLVAAVYAAKHRSAALAAGTGLLFGAAALVREISLGIAGLCGLWWWWAAAPPDRRAALGRAALVLGLALLVVLPWSWRNYTLFERIVPVSTVGWLALALGSSLEAEDWRLPRGPEQAALKARLLGTKDEMEAADLLRAYAFERIPAEQPTWLAKKTLRNLPMLFSPNSPLLYKLRQGSYGDVPDGRAAVVRGFAVTSYALVVIAGVLGIAAAGGAGRTRLPVLIFGSLAVLHVLTYADARYRVAWMPLLIAYAGFAAASPAEVVRCLRGGRLVAAGLVLLFFLGVCVPYYFEYIAGPATTPSLESGGTSQPG